MATVQDTTARNLLGWLRGAGSRFARKREGRSSAGREADLRGWIASLEELNRTTERDFLAVGGQLMDLSETIRMIRADVDALTGFVAGSQGERIAGLFESILARTMELEYGIESGRSALADVRSGSDTVQKTLITLRETLPVVSAVGTLTRIETARLGSASGFAGVADEVKALTSGIQEKVSAVLAASADARAEIDRALGQLSSLQNRELKELPTLVENVMNSLHDFEERRRKALDTSGIMADRFKSISEAIGDVVSLVQFHDITRQQVEHVVEALKELATAASRAGARRVLEVQAAQLANASEKFGASIARIGQRLGEVDAGLQEMIARSRDLLSDSGRTEAGFFVDVEKSLTQILAMLGDCDTGNRERAAAAHSLEATMCRMHQSVAGIGEIELQMQRMALNTTIQAAHIGSAADPLSVLAGGIRKLSADCGDLVQTVTESMRQMESAIEAARASGAESDGEDDPFGARRVREALAELHSASESALSRTTQVEAVGTRMCSSIRDVLDGLSVGAVFRDTTGRCIEGLQKMAGGMDRGEPGDAGLQLLSNRYTMHSERTIHEAVTEGAAVAAVPESGDLGDNVELF